MKPRTTTTTYKKALARSGPDLHPEQIRLSDDAQSDKNRVATQSDLNKALYDGGGGPGPGPSPIDPEELDKLATKEELQTEANARDTGDKANLGLIKANQTNISAISNDYTTTDEFNTLNSRVTTNTSDISSLQEGFDDALKAAKEGAENIEIEFQSTAKKADTYSKVETDATFAKKSDIPEGADLSAYAKTEYVDALTLQSAEVEDSSFTKPNEQKEADRNKHPY